MTTRISRWRGILTCPVWSACLHCGKPVPIAYRTAPAVLITLLGLGGTGIGAGAGLATSGLPAIGWPLLAAGALHHAAAWWTTTPPRAADLPGEPGDSIRS
jgi:hypothetical protein